MSTNTIKTMKTLLTLCKTNDSFASLVARLALGLVMFPHGAQKALGWFGGLGFSGTMNMFTEHMHIPALFALLAIAAEFAGSIGLIVGFSRPSFRVWHCCDYARCRFHGPRSEWILHELGRQSKGRRI